MWLWLLPTFHCNPFESGPAASCSAAACSFRPRLASELELLLELLTCHLLALSLAAGCSKIVSLPPPTSRLVARLSPPALHLSGPASVHQPVPAPAPAPTERSLPRKCCRHCSCCSCFSLSLCYSTTKTTTTTTDYEASCDWCCSSDYSVTCSTLFQPSSSFYP